MRWSIWATFWLGLHGPAHSAGSRSPFPPMLQASKRWIDRWQTCHCSLPFCSPVVENKDDVRLSHWPSLLERQQRIIKRQQMMCRKPLCWVTFDPARTVDSAVCLPDDCGSKWWKVRSVYFYLFFYLPADLFLFFSLKKIVPCGRAPWKKCQ